MAERSPTPQLTALLQADPDLVDRIFDYLLTEIPGFAAECNPARLTRLKTAVRSEFAGRERVSVGLWTPAGRRDTASQVLALFNGRNAREVARSLGISRASVYRYLKQAGPADKTVSGRATVETRSAVVSASPTSLQPPPAA